MALAQFFTTFDKRRTVVLEAISDKIGTVLALIASLNEQSTANTTIENAQLRKNAWKNAEKNSTGQSTCMDGDPIRTEKC
uniref:Uncharacterized protein n=1 Tax=Haemonchus contortus TaxID=6289 RepID=A0A7I4Z2E7_HAECO